MNQQIRGDKSTYNRYSLSQFIRKHGVFSFRDLAYRRNLLAEKCIEEILTAPLSKKYQTITETDIEERIKKYPALDHLQNLKNEQENQKQSIVAAD